MLDKGEVFDSGLLKETVNSLIAEGRRNFAIDLSPLDYIYSDAINVILAINRRILDVSGRLSLLSPISEVRSILERAGIHNILKIYETETDLLKSSEDIILQTTRFNLSELKSYQEPKPKSEFEDFRSQIGAAMQTDAPAEGAGPFGAEAFESEVADDAFAAKQAPQRPAAPHIEEPFIPPAPPPPPQRQAAYPYEQAPAPAPRRPAPVQQSFPVEQDAFEFPSAPSEPGRGKQRPAPAPQAAGPRRQDRDFDRFESEEDDFDEDMPKRSMTPVIVGIIALVIVVVGGYVGYTSFFKKEPKQNALAPVTSTPAPQTKSMPEVQPAPQPSAPSAAASSPATAAAAPSTPAPAAPAAIPAPKAAEKEPPKAASVSEKKPGGKLQASSSKSGKQQSNKISITSKPAGATVSVDGRVIGTTPFKWSDPPEGTIMLIATKSGYDDASKTIDYSGGNSSAFISLSRTKISKESSASSSSAEPPPAPAVEEPSSPPPPPPAEEPAPEPAPTPVAASPSSGGGGGESATIFISSMPPVADVYMDGKLIGKTNISKLNVTAGTHTMKFVKGAIEITEDMTFKSGDNPSHLVILKR